MGKRQTFYANLVDQRIRERGLFVRGFSVSPCIKHTHAHKYARAWHYFNNIYEIFSFSMIFLFIAQLFCFM